MKHVIGYHNGVRVSLDVAYNNKKVSKVIRAMKRKPHLFDYYEVRLVTWGGEEHLEKREKIKQPQLKKAFKTLLIQCERCDEISEIYFGQIKKTIKKEEADSEEGQPTNYVLDTKQVIKCPKCGYEHIVSMCKDI